MSSLAIGLKNRARKVAKAIYQFAPVGGPEQQRVLFIVGCQRSGTTLMRDIFERDFRTRVYGEFGELNLDDETNFRLKPLPQVRRIIEHQRARVVVAKPLSESQRIAEILDYFDGSKAVWMYRDFREVASSNLKKFGADNGISDLRNIVESGPKEWIYENIAVSTRDTVLRFFAEDMPPNDAAALFWFVRNSLYFENGLIDDERIMLCRYDTLALEPQATVDRIYRHIGLEKGPLLPAGYVSAGSVGRAQAFELSADVDAVCSDLMSRMDAVYEQRLAASGT